MKTTLVIGASSKPWRYSNMAIRRLLDKQFNVSALGIKTEEVHGVQVEAGFPDFSEIHTVSLYINKNLQDQYTTYILNLKPERVIFNPGTENPEFEVLLEKNNIKAVRACTLVLLSTNQY